jgi:V/A-type H+-transporting ATPase subunit E
MNAKNTEVVSFGVEQLIERLRDEAIQAGQSKAEDIVVDAQKRASWLIGEAEQEARRIVREAREEADAIHAAGTDALRLASRDALLKLRDTLLGSFSQEVMRLVGHAMDKQQFIEELILSLAGRVREKAGLDQATHLAVHLPEDVMVIDELRSNPHELAQGPLSVLTAAIAADLLREGVTVTVSEQLKSGLVIRLVDNAMQIDFTDEALSALLLSHLQPRFRALLQGIVK